MLNQLTDLHLVQKRMSTNRISISLNRFDVHRGRKKRPRAPFRPIFPAGIYPEPLERVLVPFLETSYCGASEHTVGVWSDDGLYPFWVYAMAQHTGMRKTPKAYRYAIFASQGYATLYISTVLYCMYITVHSRYTVQTYLYSTVLYL